MSAGLKPPVRAIARDEASAKPSVFRVSSAASRMRRRVASPPGRPLFLTIWFDQPINQEYPKRMVGADNDGRPKWLLSQRWENLLFAHWPVEPRAVKRLLPPELEPEVRAGAAWLAI